MTAPAQKPMSEREAIAALKRLAKRWPKTLWLFTNGTLYVMRKGASGGRAYVSSGGLDPEYVVTTIDIESDGGDW